MSDTDTTVMCFKCDNRPAGEGGVLCNVCEEAIRTRPVASYYEDAKR